MLGLEVQGNRPEVLSHSIGAAIAFPWRLLQTKPCQERKAENNLRTQGFETFLPLTNKIRKAGFTQNYSPLFPSYLFSRFSPEFITTVKSTYGVAYPIMRGSELAEVDERVIQEISRRIDAAGFINLDAEADAELAKLQFGQEIRIKSGAWSDWHGIFQRHEHGRIVALLNGLRCTFDSRVVALA
jgi:transcriptional antiterminator RfaH